MHILAKFSYITNYLLSCSLFNLDHIHGDGCPHGYDLDVRSHVNDKVIHMHVCMDGLL